MKNKFLLGMFLAPIMLTSVSFANENDSDTAQAIENSVTEESNNQDSIRNQVSPQNVRSPESISGFYGGIGLGLDRAKGKFSRDVEYAAAGSDETKKAAAKKNKSKSGLDAELFAGYNAQIGNFLFGLECALDMKTAKNSTAIGTTNPATVDVKRKFSFGIAPRVGYNITGGLFGYVNLGTMLSKYKVNSKDTSTSTNTSKSPTKASIFVGVGVEQSFGSLFVRGECDKIFKKEISTVETTKVSSSSYVFKIGAGYRF